MAVIAVNMSLERRSLAAYVTRQLNALFNDGDVARDDDIMDLVPQALARVEHCFSFINNKYFFDGRRVIFNHLNGDQYAMFLYLLSSVAFNLGAPAWLSTKLFLLNKSLHGIDAYFEVELPPVFLFVHPLGTVLGRASYADFFLVYQRCGVGSNHDVYPSLGSYTTLRPGSSVLGKCSLGRNNTLAAGALLMDRDLGDDSIYIGNPRDFLIRHSRNLPPVWRT